MNIGDTTIVTVLFIAMSAECQNIINTIPTSCAGDAATVAFHFKNTIGTSTLLTFSALLEINAVHTKPRITKCALPPPTAIQAVIPFTTPTQDSHISITIIILTIITVVFHAIVPCVILCSIIKYISKRTRFYHRKILRRKVTTTFQAANATVHQHAIVSSEEGMKIRLGVSYTSPNIWKYQKFQSAFFPPLNDTI
jgi:hypothetical protein